MKERKKPTGAELAILQVLWSRGPSTVREVAEAMDRENARTTVLKLLQIMFEKRLVTRNDSERTYVYDAAHSEDKTQKQIVADLLEQVFNGSGAKLARLALATGTASSNELAEIRDLLNARHRYRQSIP